MKKLYDIAEPSPAIPQGIAVGIDLGTTNSLIAFAEGGKVTLLKDPSTNKTTIPSVVNYSADGKSAVGEAAVLQVGAIASIKRLMGKGHEEIVNITNKYALASDERLLKVHTAAGAKTAEEISAAILDYLKCIAESSLGQKVTHAVITVPAYFDDAARNATKTAAKIAGLEVMRLINEPTAACFAYGLESYKEGTFAVYDLGGGTFDVSILKRHAGVFRVLATGGDSNLGGDDFDHAIVTYLTDKYAVELSKTQACQLKEQLTEDITAQLALKGKKIEFSRDELNSIIKPFLHKTLRVFKKVMRDAEVNFSDLDAVILVGGATKIPYIQAEITNLYGKLPLTSHDPETIVAEGAALQAAALAGQAADLLLDVLPLSLGIELMGEVVEVVIPRNTLLPAEISKIFTTYADGQTAFKIHILQGEGGKVNGCRSLAHFELAGLPPMTAGSVRLCINFKVDVDGILTVTASDQATGVSKEVILNPSYGLSPEEIKQIIAL